VREGRITQEDLDDMKKVVLERLTGAQERAKELKPRQRNISLGPAWKGMSKAANDWSAKTAVPREVLAEVVKCATGLPETFTPHSKIVRVLNARKQMIETGRGIDWGCAEMLAMGSLLLEKHWVRLTGQDVERGTFSHRHAILYDFDTGSRYVPLAHLAPDQGHIIIANTMLSELAVLGFEYGYTLADPTTLVMWEAQFGDFVNGAQPIIDQFLVAGESKWQLMSGLVMLLPHGFEGQGPEHSNAYMERFLSMCADDNIQVIVPTSPAQYFHSLRRQIHRKFRKPLIVFSPKSMLRYEPSFSAIEEFTDASFRNVIDDPNASERDKVRRLLLCTGKVFYTLDAARQKQPTNEVALVRVEQLYPFPQSELLTVIEQYPRVEEIAWVQEEPQNRGGWGFMEPRLRGMFPDKLITYFGRDASSSPAVGSSKTHQYEEKELLAAALAVHPRSVPAHAIPATSHSRAVSD
jgi:2-oxoglutarate dehydrogenase E1 component